MIVVGSQFATGDRRIVPLATTDRALAPSAFGAAERRIIPFTFAIDTLVDGNADATLGRPLMLSASDSLIVYFDFGDNYLAAIDARGKPKWKLGRRGQGPGEWSRPTTIVAASNGGVAVFDAGTNRLVRVDANGRITRNVTRSEPLDRLGKHTGGQYIAFAGSTGRPRAELLDSGLRIIREVPWKGWPDSAQGIGNQTRIASGATGTSFPVSIFTGRIMPARPGPSFDSGIDAIDARAIPKKRVITGTDGIAFTTIPEGTPVVIRDAAVVGKYLFVLVSGAEFGGKLMDVYEMPSVRYRASIRVPVELNAMSSTRTDVVAISNNPYPTILRLKWDMRSLEAAIGR